MNNVGASDRLTSRWFSTISLFALLLGGGLAREIQAGPAFVPGKLNREVCYGISGTAVSELTASAKYLAQQPDLADEIEPAYLETPWNFGDNYGQKISGYLAPPETGDYTFYVASDDDSEFWLSTDEQPAHKVLLTSLHGWTNSREWTGRGVASAPVTLQANGLYYFEALHKEGGGADGFGLAWKLPSQTTAPAIGSDPISSAYFGTLSLQTGPPVISQQPQNAIGYVGQSVQFIGRADGEPPLAYQWQRNQADIPGATSRLLAIPNVQLADAGQYRFVVTNGLGTATSDEALLTVSEEPVAIFADANLEAAVRSQLSIPTGAITQTEMARLTYLYASYRGIQNLGGLGMAVNLQTLYLNGNPVSDLSTLAGLTNLESLSLYNTSVNDLSSLAGLTKLRHLEMGGAPLPGLAPLVGLTNLTELYASQAQIADLALLAGLTNLTMLGLGDNAITDPAPLGALPRLIYLDLSRNPLTSAVSFAGLTNLSVGLQLSGCHMFDATGLVGLTNLQALGLSDNAITNAEVLVALPRLLNLDMARNQLSSAASLSGLTQLVNLSLSYNGLTNIADLSGLVNLQNVDLNWNYLDVSDGSPARVVIQGMTDRGASVQYMYQRTTAPSIWMQPQGRTVGIGSDWMMEVGASDAVSYQWWFNDTPITGATGSRLWLMNVQTEASGRYSVVVGNPLGAVTSSDAVLTVVEPVAPSFASQPQDTLGFVGQSANMNVGVNGTERFYYQWQFTRVDIPGQTNSWLSLNGLRYDQAGAYRVVVRN